MSFFLKNSMRLLITDVIHENALKLLNEFDVVFSKVDEVSETDFDVIILRTFTKLGKEELDKFKSLKYVVSCSVGVDNIDLIELKKRGIELIHVPGTNANSVAEHALLLLLLSVRDIRLTNDGLFDELSGKTIGFIGFGAVGRSFAKKLKGLGMNLLVYDVVNFSDDLLSELGVVQVGLDEVVRNSDVLTIHVPLLTQTKGMINSSLFSRMKKGVILLNTSRAEVINEVDFVKALNKGIVRKACLDVFSDELFDSFKNDK